MKAEKEQREQKKQIDEKLEEIMEESAREDGWKNSWALDSIVKIDELEKEVIRLNGTIQFLQGKIQALKEQIVSIDLKRENVEKENYNIKLTNWIAVEKINDLNFEISKKNNKDLQQIYQETKLYDFWEINEAVNSLCKKIRNKNEEIKQLKEKIRNENEEIFQKKKETWFSECFSNNDLFQLVNFGLFLFIFLLAIKLAILNLKKNFLKKKNKNLEK